MALYPVYAVFYVLPRITQKNNEEWHSAQVQYAVGNWQRPFLKSLRPCVYMTTNYPAKSEFSTLEPVLKRLYVRTPNTLFSCKRDGESPRKTFALLKNFV